MLGSWSEKIPLGPTLIPEKLTKLTMFRIREKTQTVYLVFLGTHFIVPTGRNYLKITNNIFSNQFVVYNEYNIPINNFRKTFFSKPSRFTFFNQEKRIAKMIYKPKYSYTPKRFAIILPDVKLTDKRLNGWTYKLDKKSINDILLTGKQNGKISLQMNKPIYSKKSYRIKLMQKNSIASTKNFSISNDETETVLECVKKDDDTFGILFNKPFTASLAASVCICHMIAVV